MNKYEENRQKPERPQMRIVQQRPSPPQTIIGHIMSIQNELNLATNPRLIANLKNEMASLLFKAIKAQNLTVEESELLKSALADYELAGPMLVMQDYKDSGKAPFIYSVTSDPALDGKEIARLVSHSEREGLDVAREFAANLQIRTLEPILINLTALAIRKGIIKIEGGIEKLPMAELFGKEQEGEEE